MYIIRSWRKIVKRITNSAIRFITTKQKEEAARQCKEFFDAMTDTLVANGEPMKIMRSFPGLANSSIAYSKIDHSIPPKTPTEEFPPIRIKISAQCTHLSAYLEFYPEEDAGAKRLLLEILLHLYPDNDHGFFHDFYENPPISPESAAIYMLTRVRVMRAVYKKHTKTFERIYQKELDFTQELYSDEAEKIIQNI